MLTVLNDTHAGAIRGAGTTPASQWALRQHLLSEMNRLLPVKGDLLLNGDLFDTANVPVYDVLRVFEILSDWLNTNRTSVLYNSAGNHDISRTSTTLSSFQFLGKLLKRSFPERYVHIEDPTLTPYGYVIPHQRNQDMFDLALEAVPPCRFLFVHANYANGFAAQSDQSLNVSVEQVEDSKAEVFVFGHEHHGKTAHRVVIPGNQIASSVADWLSPGDKKYATIEDDKLTLHTCALRADQYVEVDWRNLSTEEGKAFMRVSGAASSAEVSGAISALNRYRASSSSFVITNAIEVASDADAATSFSQSLDSVQTFDIVRALRNHLSTKEMQTVEPYIC